MKVLYFAQAAQLAGCREEIWIIRAPLTPGQFWTELENRHAGMASLRPICRLACNCNYLDPADLIQPDDEVALIPPVSGG